MCREIVSVDTEREREIARGCVERSRKSVCLCVEIKRERGREIVYRKGERLRETVCVCREKKR